MSSDDPKNEVESGADADFMAAFAEFSEKHDAEPGPVPPLKEAPPEGEAPGDEASGDEPPAETPSEAPPEPASGDEPPAEKQPAPADPWEKAPPEAKALYEQAIRERDDFQHRARSDAERVQALARKLARVSAEKAPTERQAEEQKAQPSALDDTLKKLEEDFPDIGKALKAVIEAQKSELAPVKEAISGFAGAEADRETAAQLTALESRHPDWRTIAADTSFKGWASAQPESIQKLALSWDASEVSAALDLFKAQRAAAMKPADTPQEKKPDTAAEAKRSRQLDGGADVGSRPAPAASGPPEDFDAAFEHFAAKREAQQRAAAR